MWVVTYLLLVFGKSTSSVVTFYRQYGKRACFPIRMKTKKVWSFIKMAHIQENTLYSIEFSHIFGIHIHKKKYMITVVNCQSD